MPKRRRTSTSTKGVQEDEVAPKRLDEHDDDTLLDEEVKTKSQLNSNSDSDANIKTKREGKKSKKEKKSKKKKKKKSKRKKNKSEEEILSFICDEKNGGASINSEAGNEAGSDGSDQAKDEKVQVEEEKKKKTQDGNYDNGNHAASLSSSDESSVHITSPSKKLKGSSSRMALAAFGDEDSDDNESSGGKFDRAHVSPKNRNGDSSRNKNRSVAKKSTQGTLVDSSDDDDNTDIIALEEDKRKNKGQSGSSETEKRKSPLSTINRGRKRQSRLTQWTSTSTTTRDGFNQRKVNRKKKRQSTIDKWAASAAASSSSSSSSDDDDEVVSKRRHAKNKAESSPLSSSPRRRSPRKSNVQTSRRIRKTSHDNDDNDGDGASDSADNGENNTTPTSDVDASPIGVFRSTRKQMEDDELSYKEEEGEESEDVDNDEVENDERDLFNDDMSFENEESDDDDDVNEDVAKAPAKHIKQGLLMSFEGDEESDDSSFGVASLSRKKNQIQMTPLRLRNKRLAGNDEYQMSGDDDDDDDYEILSSKPEDICRPCGTPQRTAIRCTSTHDEITMEKLPALHVCYLAPDGRTRHCFCLDTLYKASIMSNNRRMKETGVGVAGLSFLQPPHFRTAMDDKLVDQIASRFGRSALIIEDSDVYKKQNHVLAMSSNRRIPDHESFGIDVDEPEQSFRAQFDQYLNNQMGSQDIYCCPICYYEAQLRFETGEEDDDENSDLEPEENDYSMKKLTDYRKADPMSILGSLDHDEFQIAAKFCFLKVASVKAHLRSVHNVDTSGIYGNDLYKGFMVSHFLNCLERLMIDIFVMLILILAGSA